MIAYNEDWLNNLLIREDIDHAFDEKYISKEEQDAIHAKFPVGFYTPNFFIRIGLFIVTLIIMLFSFGLMALVSLNSFEKTFGGLLIFFSIISYGALELLVKNKNHYRAGVDDALMLGSAAAFTSGVSYTYDLSFLWICIIVFIVTLYLSLRFADRLMTIVAYASLFGIIFFTCIESGTKAKAIVPFVLMATSVVIYFAAGKLRAKQFAIHYSGCLGMILILSLAGFYAAGNYFVVRELSNSMFHSDLQPGQTIPFGWFFWVLTLAVPVIYILLGIQKKDAILLRVGMLLIAAIVFTVRYYHTIMPVEILMTTSGVVLLLIAYGLMKYLHEPKHGFTYKDISQKNALDKLNVESLLIAQTFSGGAQQPDTKIWRGKFCVAVVQAEIFKSNFFSTSHFITIVFCFFNHC